MPRKTAAKPAPTAHLTEIDTILIPLDALYLHPLNPRRDPPDAEIAALAESIARAGLLQNLSGFDDPEKIFRDGFSAVGIVGGGRRLRALQLLAARGDWTADVPVRVTDDLDTAKLWAGTENETVEGLPAADRIIAYRQMRETGASTEAIAATFAKPISDVRRLLALANLPDAAIDALRTGVIDFDMAKTLTTAATPADLDAALRSAITKDKQSWEIRDMLRKQDLRATDRLAVFLGMDAYYAAGGISTVDLFKEDTWLHDRDLVQRLATEKALAVTEALRVDEGWAWARYLPENSWALRGDLVQVARSPVCMSPGDQTRLDFLHGCDGLNDDEKAEMELLEARALAFTDADRETCGILTVIRYTGEMRIDRGFRDKTTKAPAADDDTIETHPAAPEAAFPQNLRDDLRHIRLIVIQDALRRDPDLCQHLLAMQLSGLVTVWEAPFGLTAQHGQSFPAATLPSKMDGFRIPGALAAKPAEADPVAAATALREDGVPISALVTNGLARAFCRTEGPLVDAIAARQTIVPRTLWHPTAAGFLTRVSEGYLRTLWRDLVPDEGSRHAGFDTMKKKDKARELEKLFADLDYREALGLTRAENTRIDAWVPEDLRFASTTPDDPASD